jgi:hypothetical protein
MPEQKPLSNAMKSVLDRLFTTFAQHLWESILSSYTLASPLERCERLAAIMRLSAMLAPIKAESIFASAIHGDALIEAIIEGDWKNARRIALDIRFDDMSDDAARRFHVALWAPFRAHALAACDAADLRVRVELAEIEAARKRGAFRGD